MEPLEPVPMGALPAVRSAEAALKGERNRLLAGVAMAHVRIKKIDAALEGLGRYAGPSEAGEVVAAPGVPQGPFDAIVNGPTQKAAALRVFALHPKEQIHGRDLWQGMVEFGARSSAKDPLNVVDTVINDLQKAGYPVRRAGQRVFVWEGDPPDLGRGQSNGQAQGLGALPLGQ